MTYVLFNPLACHDKMEEVIAPLVDSLGQDVRALDIREINDYAALLGDLGEQDSLIICGGVGQGGGAIKTADFECRPKL